MPRLPSRRACRATALALVGALAASSASAGVPPADAPVRVAAADGAAAGCKPGRPVREHPIRRRRWLSGVAITEYYSTPERWFRGRAVRAPGLRGRHRVDWLYTARGVAMQGDGIGVDGRHYHIDALGRGGWVDPRGRRTRPGRCAGRWSAGPPAWLEGGWRDARGRVTFPLRRGGWSRGRGRRRLSYRGVTFARGSTIPLRPYRTAAVDRRLIPRGSRIYIPAYRRISGGWFVAQDTGGAIIGRHIDVYRRPPRTPRAGGRFLQDQRVLVVPPRR
jgi:3D (Asp-Asp-Asp) domain-containing protein